MLSLRQGGYEFIEKSFKQVRGGFSFSYCRPIFEDFWGRMFEGVAECWLISPNELVFVEDGRISFLGKK